MNKTRLVSFFNMIPAFFLFLEILSLTPCNNINYKVIRFIKQTKYVWRVYAIMNQTIAVIGGDGRYLELIRQLQTLPGTTIMLIGLDKFKKCFTRLMQIDYHDLDTANVDAVIFPTTGTDDNGNVQTVFSDQPVQLTKQWFQQLTASCLIFTGITNHYLSTAAEE